MSRKQKPRANTPRKRRLRLAAVLLLLYGVCFLAAAGCAYKVGPAPERIRLIGLGVFAIAALLGGYLAGRSEKKNGLLAGLLACLPLHLSLLAASLVVNRGNVDLTIAFSAAIWSLCAMLGGVIAVNRCSRAKKVLKGTRV